MRLRELNRRDWLRPSVVALVLANLVPVFGVLFLGWEVFPLMFLFWFENVIVGVFNVLRMASAGGGGLHWAGKLFLIPFFAFHYGMFTLVHGIFVLALFGGEESKPRGLPNPAMFLEVIRDWHLHWAALGLIASHGVSFYTNFIRGGEYLRANPGRLMAQPYARIFVMHAAILGGGLLMAALNSPLAGLLVLIALKIVIDVAAHVSERKKFAREPDREDAKVD